MNVITRIYQGFFALLILILITGIYMVYIGGQSVKRADQLMADVEKRQLANEMKEMTIQVQQWLTDISATRGMEGFDDGFDEAETHAKRFKMKAAELKRLYAGTEWKSFIATTERDFDGYYAMGIEMANAYIKGGPALGNPMMEKFDPYAEKITTSVDKIVVASGDKLGASLTEAKTMAKQDQFMGTLGMIIGFVLGMLIAWKVSSSLRTNLVTIAGHLSNGSREVTTASQQISSSSQSLAEGATEQASSIEETSAALEQMGGQTKQNSENADKASKISNEAKDDAENGAEQMKEMILAMEQINESSGMISKIIKVIEEIAFQTNLLALNAAVEAARAGEHGKGFAVVAEEVRNLAQRSATAAKDTANLIEDAVGKAAEGNAIAKKAGESLSGIVTGVENVTNLIEDIAASSREQALGVDQVNKAVTEMDKVIQANASSAEEAAAASEELSAQAMQLDDMVNQLSALVGMSQNGSSNDAVMGNNPRRLTLTG